MPDEWGTVLQPDDITDEFAEDFFEACVSGWYDEGGIEWEQALERWEKYHRDENRTFGPQLDSPAIRRLQRKVRALRAEAGI
jgi:hypothetical protein